MMTATIGEKGEVKPMARRTMMRAAAGLFGALAIGTLATGCSMVAGERRTSVGNGPSLFGSGRSITKDYPLKGFTAIEVGSAFKVDVAQAADFAVAVTADDNLFDQVDVYVEGDTLRIAMKPGSFVNAGYRASVKLPALKRIQVSGASTAYLSGITTDEQLDVRASGASRLEGDVKANSLNLDLSGASKATLNGTAAAATLEVGGASSAKLEGLRTKDVRANLSGASTASVDASDSLDANLSGASRLTYAGQAKVSSQSVTGASTLARK
jgi:hypothetical protein